MGGPGLACFLGRLAGVPSRTRRGLSNRLLGVCQCGGSSVAGHNGSWGCWAGGIKARCLSAGAAGWAGRLVDWPAAWLRTGLPAFAHVCLALLAHLGGRGGMVGQWVAGPGNW